MSQITIVPTDGIVILDSSVASGVDMTSVDPEIHAVQFNTESSYGAIEYKANSVTGITPQAVLITSIEPWERVIGDAEEIIFCKKNPKVFYSIIPPVGRKITVTERGWPQPSNSTEKSPTPQPNLDTTLYWNGFDFEWSVFPIDLPLSDAQNFVAKTVSEKTYSLLQPSDWMVVRQSETGRNVPEDWVTWREAVREESKGKREVIFEKEDLASLSAYCNSVKFRSWPPSP